MKYFFYIYAIIEYVHYNYTIIASKYKKKSLGIDCSKIKINVL